MSGRPARVLALGAILCLGLTACTGDGDGSEPTPSATVEPGPERGAVQQPADPATVLPGAGGPLALAASRAFFAESPIVVLADDADPDSQLRASSVALALGAPVLLDDDVAAVAEEVARLEAGWLLTVGEATAPGSQDGGPSAEPSDGPGAEDVVVVPAPDSDDALGDALGVPTGEPVEVEDGQQTAAVLGLERGSYAPLQAAAAEEATGEPEEATGDPEGTTGEPEDTAGDGADLPPTEPPDPVTGTLALTTGAPEELLATATAGAAGSELLLVPDGDPRATSETVTGVADAGADHVVGLGEGFGDAETLGWRTATAATGVELPGGGQRVFPGKRYVALYGTPSTSALGVLGEQGVAETVARAVEHAAPYEELVDDTVVPSLEIIATVASSSAGADGNYSNELPPESLRPLVEAAGEEAGQYVLLDLQPGRSSFREQAEQYAELLALPHVGLALDPEWNLTPEQRHLEQIGWVSAEEVNEVVTWLADFTRERDLPQKMLVLHQFQVQMIRTVPEVDLSRSELAVLVHADGQGGQGDKQATWRTLHEHGPDIQWWGWKNFYDEDSPMLTPEQTVAQVDPVPHFISYQ